MVLGRSRPRPRADGSRLFAVRDTSFALQPAQSWSHERGSTLFTAGVDVLGGFPGYADRGCLLTGAQLRITDRYLLVDEGQAQGFGLPIDWLDGTVLVDLPGRDDYAVRVFYRSGGCSRLFTLKFRGGLVGGRGGRKSLRAREALHAAGLDDRYAEHPPLEPEFTLPWEQTREFEHENVIWTGRASAPVRVGAESAPSEVWLTTKSLIWGSGDGEGINRIPLPLLMDVVSTRLRDRIGTPVIYVAIGDGTTGRYELPFAFNLHTPPDRNFRERGAFLVGLRSRGLGDGIAAPYSQPWRATLLSVDDDEEARAVSRLHAREAPHLSDGFEQPAGEPGDNLFAAESAYDVDLEEQDFDEEPPRPLPRPDNISHISEIFERRRAAARRATPLETHAPAASPADRPPPPPMFLRADPVFDLDVTPAPAGGPSNPLLAAYTEIAAQAPHRSADSSGSQSCAESETAPPVDADSDSPAAEDIVVADAKRDWDEPREDPTERFATLTPLEPDSSGEAIPGTASDVVLAEWSAPSDAIDVDLALSERWALPPDRSERTAETAPARSEPPADAVPVEVTGQSPEPPGWWPDFGDDRTEAMPADATDRVLDDSIEPIEPFEPVEPNLPVAETGIDHPRTGAGIERLLTSGTQASDTDEWPAVRAYEETAIGALSDVLRVIDARAQGDRAAALTVYAPASWEQARALAELTEMAQHGAISAEDARHRRERLTALGEVCVRLRTLVELHANGILAADQLDAKRESLLQGLSDTLARGDAGR